MREIDEPARELAGVALAFDDARPRDQDERAPATDDDLTNGDRIHGVHYTGSASGPSEAPGWPAGGERGAAAPPSESERGGAREQ